MGIRIAHTLARPLREVGRVDHHSAVVCCGDLPLMSACLELE